MSTITYTATSTITRIPLGRRILELMSEKGEAYSIRAFADRIGFNRESLRLMLLGARRIAPSEFEIIAKGLGVSVDRLKQIDSNSKEQELTELLKSNKRSKSMMEYAHKLASELESLALGATERGFALNNLGRVQYLQKQYNAAHETWLRALEFAKKLKDQADDSQLLHIISANLMLTYTIRKEYSNIEEVLSYVEMAFPEDPDTLGMTYSTRMRVQNDIGNLEQAKQYADRSLEYFKQTNNNRQIGHGLINVAYCAYLLGEYKESETVLVAAINIVKPHEDILVIAVKNYVKTLMKLQEYKTAIQIVEKYNPILKDYPDYWAKMQILYTVLKDDPLFADQIVNDSNINPNIRYFACKCLFEFYAKKDDVETSMKYYKKGRNFSTSKVEFYDEEGF